MICRIYDVPGGTLEQYGRYLAAGLGEAMQAAGVPEPTITDFEVHKLAWLG